MAVSAITGLKAVFTEDKTEISGFNKIPFKFVKKSNKADITDTLLKLKGIMVKISYKNKDPTLKARGIFLVYWEPVSKISVNFMLIIIITKRNKTVIAPTYNIIYVIPIKPTPVKIK